MADLAAWRQQCEADRAALVEANTEMLEVYARLASGYAATIARRSQFLETVDGTLLKVRDILAGT